MGNELHTKEGDHMTWDAETWKHYLSHLSEESRHYRGFHHTLMSVCIAGYAALLGFLMALLLDQTQSSGFSCFTGIVVYVVAPLVILVAIPILLSYMIITYHLTQGNIRNHMRILQELLEYPIEQKEDVKYSDFQNRSLLSKIFTGRGHIVFLILLWLLVGTNGCAAVAFLCSNGLNIQDPHKSSLDGRQGETVLLQFESGRTSSAYEIDFSKCSELKQILDYCKDQQNDKPEYFDGMVNYEIKWLCRDYIALPPWDLKALCLSGEVDSSGSHEKSCCGPMPTKACTKVGLLKCPAVPSVIDTPSPVEMKMKRLETVK